MNIDFIDIDNLLELNPNMKISVKKVSKEQIPILIIDDFYLNPDPIRELFFKVPVPRMPPELNLPYKRARVRIPNFLTSNKFQKKLSTILKNFFKIEYDLHNRDYEFLFNIFGGCLSDYCDAYFAPHSDPYEVACIVYFNKNSEKVGGTSIYRHKKTDTVFNPKIDFHKQWWEKNIKYPISFKKELFDYENTLNHLEKQKYDNWEIVETIDSKYNRFVAYIGGMLHGSSVDLKELKDKPYYRINQVLFMQR